MTKKSNRVDDYAQEPPLVKGSKLEGMRPMLDAVDIPAHRESIWRREAEKRISRLCGSSPLGEGEAAGAK